MPVREIAPRCDWWSLSKRGGLSCQTVFSLQARYQPFTPGYLLSSTKTDVKAARESDGIRNPQSASASISRFDTSDLDSVAFKGVFTMLMPDHYVYGLFIVQCPS